MSQIPLRACVREVRDSRGRLVALYCNVSCFAASEEGTWIPTPSSWGLQVGVFKHGKGYRVGAHLHLREHCGEHVGSEALFVVRGKLKVQLFDENGNSIGEFIIGEGDCLVMNCAHSVEVLEDALVLEVKEGPYPGPKEDKLWISA